MKANLPKTKIILAANAERASHAAAELCELGPQRKRPYDPQQLIQQIKVHLAKGLNG